VSTSAGLGKSLVLGNEIQKWLSHNLSGALRLCGRERQKSRTFREVPAYRQINRTKDSCGKPASGIIDRPAHVLHDQASLLGEAAKLAGRPEAGMAPESRSHPGSDAPRRRPGAPLAKLADDEPASGPQYARDFPKNRARVINKAKDGDGRYDVELLGRKRQMFGRPNLKSDIYLGLCHSIFCRFDHGG